MSAPRSQQRRARPMSLSQRRMYLNQAGNAYAVAVDPDDQTAPSLEQWRRDECRYATGGKSFSDGLTNSELTRALCNFQSWIDYGHRASDEQMTRAANRKQVEALRPLWDAIQITARTTTMRSRFKITLLEEAELFTWRELQQLRWTLERLAKEYPRRGGPADGRLQTADRRLKTDSEQAAAADLGDHEGHEGHEVSAEAAHHRDAEGTERRAA